MRLTSKQAKAIRRLAKRGLSTRHIALWEGMPGRHTVERVVRDYRTGEDIYDPYIDEVAVWRTLQGDRKVGSRLTRFEHEHVIEHICAVGTSNVNLELAALGLGTTAERLKWLVTARLKSAS